MARVLENRHSVQQRTRLAVRDGDAYALDAEAVAVVRRTAVERHDALVADGRTLDPVGPLDPVGAVGGGLDLEPLDALSLADVLL